MKNITIISIILWVIGVVTMVTTSLCLYKYFGGNDYHLEDVPYVALIFMSLALSCWVIGAILTLYVSVKSWILIHAKQKDRQ